MQRPDIQSACYAGGVYVGCGGERISRCRECYLEKFKMHFKVDFFEGSSTSPLDSEQAEAPSWVKEYYEHL